MSWAELKRGDPAEYARRIANRSRAGIKGAATIRRDKMGVFDPKIRAMGIEALRKRGLSFFDPKVQREMSRRAVRLAKLRKTSFFDPTHRIQKMGAKKGGVAAQKVQKERGLGVYDPKVQLKMHKTLKEMGVGIYNPESVVKSLELQRKNKTGFFDPSHWIQKIGGPASQKARRENSPYWFMGVPFDSNGERQVAKKLHELTGFVPTEGTNCHFKVDGGEIDFLVNGVFIEYHPWDRKLSSEQYYEQRRKLLDKNGYKSARLQVVYSVEKLAGVLQRLDIGGVSN